MGKQSGLGDNYYLGGYNLSGDVNSLGTISCPLQTDGDTGIDKFAHERLPLLRDGLIEWVSYFNDAPGAAHPVLSALPTTDQQAYYARGTVLGNPAYALLGKQINYDITREDSGALRAAVSAMANGYGGEWGVQLTAGQRVDVAASNGASVDTTASADFGAQAYLQVFAFSGTDATIKVQDSADDVSFADVAGLAFTQVTASPVTGRVTTANTATIRRYLRVVTVTTGGFSAVQFAVMVNKNEIAGVEF